MRQLEKLTAWTLFVVFFYSLISLSLNFLNTEFGYLIPNVNLIIIVAILSAIFGTLSPFFDVGKYLGTYNIKKIVEYRTRCEIKFLNLFLGYVGILFWMRSKVIFDAIWLVGVLLVTICTSYFFIFVFLRPKFKVDVH